MRRTPEPEIMSDEAEARAYQAADFGDVDTPYIERLLDLIQERRRQRKRLRILDLGTGPADIPVRIAKRLPQVHICALDASAAMLTLAKQKIKSRHGGRAYISLIRSDAKNLPFADKSFDAIISNSLLHHIHRPQNFWREIRRVAKPDAVILVQDLFRPPNISTARALVRKHARHESKPLQQLFYQSLLAAFRLAEILRQLRAANLSYLKVSVIDDRHLAIEGRI